MVEMGRKEDEGQRQPRVCNLQIPLQALAMAYEMGESFAAIGQDLKKDVL